jgi:AraC-like DNA-binding protein
VRVKEAVALARADKWNVAKLAKMANPARGDDLTAITLDAGFASHSHFTARFRSFFALAAGWVSPRPG